jgi:hypothetical protein
MDPFENNRPKLESPGEHHFTVVPSDTLDLPFRPRSLYINTAGTVRMREVDGTEVTYNVTAGQILAFRPVRIMATGTTAAVIGWY